MAKTLPPVEVPEPDVVIAVYDAKTGAIRHVHQEISLPGSTPPPRSEQLQRAIAFAREIGESTSARLDALPIEPRDRSMVLRSRVPLKVDLKKRTIVPAVTRRTTTATTRSRH